MKKLNFAYKNRGVISGWILVILFLCSTAGAASPAKLSTAKRAIILHEANNFFRLAGQAADSGQAAELYNKALLRYKRLTRTGLRNGKLYYNIGNTYFRLHDLGRAILNYRLAGQYLPDDQNLEKNLTFALSRQPDEIIPRQRQRIMKTLLFWHYDLSSRTRWFIFAVACLLFWIIAFVRLAKGRHGPGLAAILPFLIAMLMGGSLAVNHLWPPKQAGVLLAHEEIARKGDGLSYRPSFTEPLHAGLDFDLLEKRNSWLHIELRDGRRCWIPAASAAIVDLAPSG